MSKYRFLKYSGVMASIGFFFVISVSHNNATLATGLSKHDSATKAKNTNENNNVKQMYVTA